MYYFLRRRLDWHEFHLFTAFSSVLFGGAE